MENIIISFLISLSVYFYFSFKDNFIKMSFILLFLLIVFLSLIKNFIYYQNFIIIIFSFFILLFVIFLPSNFSSKPVRASKLINFFITFPLFLLVILLVILPNVGLYWQVLERKFVIFIFDPNENLASRLIFDSSSINILIYFLVFSFLVYLFYLIKFYDNNLFSSLIFIIYLFLFFHFIALINFLDYLIIMQISSTILIFIYNFKNNLFFYNDSLLAFFLLIIYLISQNNLFLINSFDILYILIIGFLFFKFLNIGYYIIKHFNISLVLKLHFISYFFLTYVLAIFLRAQIINPV
jgi:hypothetical protein